MTGMPEVPLDSDTSQHTEQVIVGVDTHKDTHLAAVITLVGVLVDSRAFPATAAGYRRLLAWARSLGAMRGRGGRHPAPTGRPALDRNLRREGIAVVEVNRPDRAARRRRAKTDPVDAEAAARAVLDGRATVTPKTTDGPVEMLRMFRLARASAVKSPPRPSTSSRPSSSALTRHCANLCPG